VSFKKAVGQTLHLEKAWCAGLLALRAEDKPHIVPEDTRRLRGSVDVDKALQKVEPNANRWDFGIAYQHADLKEEFVYWVELHTASDSQVKVVIRKAEWLRRWLGNGKNPLNDFQREFIWVSSGATTFTLTSPQKKTMAAAGLMHSGLKLHIPDKRG
jgi:hypothetical protein